MTFNRRTVVAGLGATLPASLLGSCAWANEAGWPGEDTPAGQLPKLPIGMNLAGIADWEPGFPFRNLMWGARPWMSQNAFGSGPWDTGQAKHFEFDENGYPLEVPLQTPGSNGIPQRLFTLLPNVRSPGRYVVYYDGQGTFDAGLGTRIVTEKPGRVTLAMAHDGLHGEMLIIRTSKRGNHIRNIRILPEAEDVSTLGQQPFLPEMLAFLRPFHALRFMDWGVTNNSLEDEWSSRRRPTFYTMVGKSGDADGFWGPKPDAYQRMFSGGVAHEIIIQLANTLRIDPWICIPHRATDEYITRCARLYRENLAPDRRLYLEYSNEVWNWQFQQAQWMLRSELAGDLVAQRGVTPWKEEAGQRKGTAHPERMGALFSRAFKLWLQEWRGADRKRVTTVCALQAGWADVSLRTMDWCHRDGFVDAASITGYFGAGKDIYADWDRKGADLTADDVIAAMWKAVETQNGRGSAFQIASRAKQLGLGFINYEGGQHIQPEGQQEKPYMPALTAAQTHPEMYRLYVETLRQQKRLGSSLFCAFSSVGRQGTRWGSWGAVPSYETPLDMSPKLKALLDCNR